MVLTVDCFRMGCVTQGEAVVDDVLRLVRQGADVNFQARASPACCYDYHQLTSLWVCVGSYRGGMRMIRRRCLPPPTRVTWRAWPGCSGPVPMPDSGTGRTHRLKICAYDL